MITSVLLASQNAHKLVQARGILREEGISVLAPEDVPLRLDVEESGGTFARNATLKALAYLQASGLTTIADDSGLQVDALGGFPGVRSARILGPDATDGDRYRFVLEKLREAPLAGRTARLVTVVAVAVPGQPLSLFEGILEGKISTEPRGTMGFGYDPILLLPHLNRTLAELSPEEAYAISHRGQALRAAARYLRQFPAPTIIESGNQVEGHQ